MVVSLSPFREAKLIVWVRVLSFLYWRIRHGDHHWLPMVQFKWLHWHHVVAMCLPQSLMKANGIIKQD